MARYYPNPYLHMSHLAADYDDEAAQSLMCPSRPINSGLNIVAELKSRTSRLKTREIDGYLYVGPPGIAYTFWTAARSISKGAADSEPVCKMQPMDPKVLLNTAKEYLEPTLQHIQGLSQSRVEKKESGFLIGCSGVFAVATVVFNDLNMEREANSYLDKFRQLAPHIKASGANGSNELLIGRAGYIMGALWLQKQLRYEVLPASMFHEICQAMLTDGIQYSQRVRSPCPIMYEYYGTEYLGAAHGVCTIIQMLLSVPGFYERCSESQRQVINASIDYLLSLQTPEGNFPCAMDEALGQRKRASERELIHWCHGAPGTIYLLIKAYLRLGRQDCLQAALKCGDIVWRKGLLKKGPGICHGVAGSGYVFLMLYRLTSDEIHLFRAKKCSDFMDTSEEFHTHSYWKPDCPFSLYEGVAGTACFLLDFIDPSRAEFPFFTVFD